MWQGGTINEKGISEIVTWQIQEELIVNTIYLCRHHTKMYTKHIHGNKTYVINLANITKVSLNECPMHKSNFGDCGFI